MIENLTDIASFRERRRKAWELNREYWLTSPLRHVNDVGQYIVDRIHQICRQSGQPVPVLVDMGCGNAWLLKALRERNIQVDYIGIDDNPAFLQFAKHTYGTLNNTNFVSADFDSSAEVAMKADIVINSFNFFELYD